MKHVTNSFHRAKKVFVHVFSENPALVIAIIAVFSCAIWAISNS